jgi:REP element-mobilizing transposase RayT
MPSQKTPIIKNGFYHVIARGSNKQNIFIDNEDFVYFMNLIRESHKKYQIMIHSYCLMNNHYHLLVETPEANLPDVMHYINQNYAYYYLRKFSNKDGHVFRGRYKKFLVKNDKYFTTLCRYIHLNPVKANLIRNPQEWTWSSYRHYLEPTNKPIFLEIQMLNNYLASNQNTQNFREFHAELTSVNDENLLKAINSDKEIKYELRRWS